MSFDGQTASTLDVIEMGFQAPERRQHRAPARAMVASTVDGKLVPEARLQASNSSIGPMLVSSEPFTIESDLGDFRAWLERTGVAAVLELAANEFARHMGATGLKVLLETEAEDPRAQRAVVLAPVSLHQQDALERLFSFTSSSWWLSVVRGTRNAIIVDIEAV